MKKQLSLALAIIMLIAAVAGCGAETGKAGETAAENEAYGVFHSYFAKAPTSLNSFVNTDTQLSNINYFCQALLYNDIHTEDGNNWEWYCELAQEFPQKMDEEGKVWRISMKPGLKWSNGEPLNIDDYIYSIQMLVDPLQVNVSAPSLTTSVYMQIVNLYEYSKGKCSWEDVGIKKIDDLTVEFTGTYPVPAINVMRFSIGLYMVYKPIYEAGLFEDRSLASYGTSLDQFMCCGPFKLVEWIPDAKFTLVRNEYYVYPEKIHIEGVDYKVVPDPETAIQLFMKGELDYCTLAYTDWEKFEDDPRVYEYFNDSLMYGFINLGNPNQNNLLGSHDYREALNHGCDRVEIANTIDVYPVARYVRRSVIGNAITNQAFVDFPQDYVPDVETLYNPDLAREYLAKAFEEKGLKSATLEILEGETATHSKAVDEMLQKQYDNVFEGKLKATIRRVPSTYALRRWNPDDPTSYELSIGSMLPSSNDPRASFKAFISSYNPPRVCWNNEAFDKLYDEAISLDLFNEDDAEKIIDYCHKMEKMMLDDLVILPLYEKSDKVLYSERIQLPVNNYVICYGWGTRYMTIKKDAAQ